MRTATKKKLIYLRYILSPAIMLVIPLLMLIPSYSYVVGGDLKQSISAWSLIGESFSSSRQILFVAGEHSAADISAARTMLILLIVFFVLYLLAFAAAVYCAAVAMKYFFASDEQKAERMRTLFVTFFPNRICVTVVELLILPLMMLPYFMPYFFESTYRMNVTLVFSAPDALMLSGIFLIGMIALSVVCAPMEREFDADIFKKSKDIFDDNEQTEQYEEDESDQKKDEDEIAREERNRRIRELLGQKKDD